MARQKTVQEPKKKKARNDVIADAPKCGKQRRSNKQIERVKKDGTKIAGIVGMILTLSSIKWKVSSQTLRDVWYTVRLNTNGLVCDCPANAGGKKICKHAFAVHKLLEKEWWHRARKRIRIVRHDIRCRYCNSCDMVKNGKRKCKRKESVQRYKCKSCHRTFSEMDGFRGKHLDATIIVESLYMIAAKMSANDVRKDLKLRGIYVHETTISKWTSSYSQIMSKYVGHFTCGYRIHVACR